MTVSVKQSQSIYTTVFVVQKKIAPGNPLVAGAVRQLCFLFDLSVCLPQLFVLHVWIPVEISCLLILDIGYARVVQKSPV